MFMTCDMQNAVNCSMFNGLIGLVADLTVGFTDNHSQDRSSISKAHSATTCILEIFRTHFTNN